MNFNLLIDGSDVHVYLYIDGSPFEVVCATDSVFEEEWELIGATTPESGVTREFRKRLRTFSMSITGATTSDNDSNVSIFEFLEDESTSDPLDMSIVFTNHAGATRSIRADWYMERVSINSPAGAASQFDLLLRGSGGYSTTDLTDPVTGSVENITSDTFTLAGGSFTDARLNGSTIIGVWQEGSNMESLSLTYTHVGSTITPDPAFAIDGQKYFVIWTF